MTTGNQHEQKQDGAKPTGMPPNYPYLLGKLKGAIEMFRDNQNERSKKWLFKTLDEVNAAIAPEGSMGG